MIGRIWRHGSLLLLASTLLWLVACRTPNPANPTVVQVTRLVTVVATPEPIEVTRVVVATAPALATAEGDAATFIAEDPRSLRYVTVEQPKTLDPVLGTDMPSRTLLANVLEPLLFPHPFEPGSYLPLLATNWRTSDDGLTVVFTIRPGVSFSDDSTLTASDIAYSIQRALLLSPTGGPQGQLLEPLLGITANDIVAEIDGGIYLGDRETLIAEADAQELVDLCERVKSAVVADDSARTVTFTLSQSWGALPATLSQPWTGAVDRDWAIAQGAWDDSCDTWQNWYAPALGESALDKRVMGTGPYVLDHWTAGIEYLLFARPDYWRGIGIPLWDAPEAPGGAPAISSVAVQFEPEAATRLLLLQQGMVDIADIASSLRLLADQWVGELCALEPDSCVPGPDPQAQLRKLAPLPNGSRTDLLFNFAISPDANPYLGSGQLDGAGIPADFFTDLNVRRAFSHCIDANQLIDNAYFGLGIANNSVVPPFMLGYNPQQESRMLDLDQCREELQLAWNGQVAGNGFRMQVPFVAGNRAHEVILTDLQGNLQQVDPRYQLELLGLPELLYLEALQNGRLPLLFLTWTETVPDPHNWAVPYLIGPYTEYQGMPENQRDQFELLVDAGAAAVNPAGRDRIYADLGRVRYAVAPNIIFPQAGDAQYQQRWITRWLVSAASPTPYFYAYAKE